MQAERAHERASGTSEPKLHEGVRILSVSSIERARPPSPGVSVPPFFWSNVVDGPPPRRAKRGKGTYVIYHAMELDAETRLAFSTVVTVDPGKDVDDPHDDTIRVDSRMNVQRRFFLEFMSKEAAVMEGVTARWRERLIRSLVAQRRFAARVPNRWVNRGLMAGIRVQGRVGLWTIHTTRRASRAAARMPDELLTHGLRAWSHLGDRVGRKGLVAGMKDPRTLSNEQKSVVMLLSTSILVATIFLLNNLILLFPKFGASPQLQGAILAGYSQLVSTFVWGVATAVLLPFPPSEILALSAYAETGPILAFLAITLSKAVGAWLVFFIGDALHESISKQTAGKPRLERMVGWMHENSRKYGFFILVLFTAAPFLPDTLALYVFAVSGMTFRSFIWGAVIGTSIRYSAILGVAHFLGKDALTMIPGL